MFASLSARAAPRASRSAMARPIASGSLLFAYLMLGACAGPPTGPVAAADPQSATAPITYRPALSGYEAARPVEPTGWRERNDAVAPKEKAQ
jgi:hypothetical protein